MIISAVPRGGLATTPAHREFSAIGIVSVARQAGDPGSLTRIRIR